VQSKLLFVIDNISTGGAQRQLSSLAIGLARRNYKVDLFCFAPGDLLAKPLYEAGITVHWKIKKTRYSPEIIFALSNLIEGAKYELVVSFLSTPNFYAILAGRLIGRRRVPVVVSERFCDLPQGVSITERFVRQFYRFASHVTVNSHHQRLNLAKKYPKIQNRLSTIYNGCDLEVFVPCNRKPFNNPLKILTIASISPYKNGLCLVEALSLLRQRCGLEPNVTWIGQRVMSGDRLEYLKAMEQKIRLYNLQRQWQWVDPRSDIVKQLHQHDVLVHPSFGEGLPNVVCEALSCASPVILSDTLDHSRLVQHNKSGYLFNWKDPSDLADKIRSFSLLSLGERTRMGHSGRSFAETHLSLNRFVDDYERLFSKYLH
jgi:glycosyltransferase involved in cell wall biosynthesis